MEIKREVKSDSEKIREVCQKTGLSEFSLSVYAAMMSKTNPIRIKGLFRVVCPNREGIRSLSQEKIRAFEARIQNENNSDTNNNQDDPTRPVPSKKSKKSSDDWRRSIVKEREKEITQNGIKIGGTTDGKKKISPRQKELQLIWEFLGWGQTSANFYVYVYYIGPENKGEDFIELTRPENWHIVPESHLVLFLKNMGDAHNYFQQSPLSVKESSGNNAHIDYDVRYILSKWKSGQKAARKEQIELVKANIHLFEQKVTMRVKYDCKRSVEADEELSTITQSDATAEEKERKRRKKKKDKKDKKDKSHKKGRKKEKDVSNRMIEEEDVNLSGEAARITKEEEENKRPKQYEVKTEKYRRVIVDEYLDITRYPLCANNTISFDIRSIDSLIKNAIADPARKPASYKWDPTEKIIKPWMIASSMVRLRKQIVQTIMKRYNLCFESSDFDAIHYFITHNKEAADDIKRYFDSFTWSYCAFNVLTMRGFIPDSVDERLNQ